MKVLIDTNVALNKLLMQPNFFAGSNAVFRLAELGQISGFISASAVTDIYYIASKKLGKKYTIEGIKKMLQVFKPATITDNNIFQALALEWNDFEDSVQYVVVETLEVDYIVTRNTSDFASGSITAVTPEEFLIAIADL